MLTCLFDAGGFNHAQSILPVLDPRSHSFSLDWNFMDAHIDWLAIYDTSLTGL